MPITLTIETAKDAPKGAAVGIGVLAGPKGPVIPPGVALSDAVLVARGFEAKLGQTLVVPGRTSSQILVGIGPAAELSSDAFRTVGAALARASFGEVTLATSVIDVAPARIDRANAAQALTEGILLASYTFTVYKSKQPVRALTSVSITGKGGRAVTAGVAQGRLVAEAVALNRDLVNEPPMTMTPTRMADIAVEIGERDGLFVTVWDEHDIERERLGGLRMVSLGSSEPPRFIRVEYRPPATGAGASKAKVPTLALVGKGITFDSGGLSLKPSDSMLTMKNDMSGAGAVLGVMSVITRLQPTCRVIGYCCVTENMPGPSAYKLLDVLTARNGKTVEVHNTDAEGRLVLMDGLSVAVEEKPDAIIDLATLTGAQIVALGTEICALMSNSASFRVQVLDAAERAGEDFWHLPLPKKYRRHLDSAVADMKNIGLPGQAGTCIAGLFLEEFVGGRPWVHLDIAGPAFTSADEGIITKGGTGVAVRTLIETILKFTPPTSK